MRKRIISLVMAICMLCGLALNGIVLPASAATFVTDFDDVATGNGIPEGWVHPRTQKAGNTAYSVIADPDIEGNQILKLSQTAKRNSWYEILYKIGLTSLPVTLEYRYKVDSGTTGMLYMPSFVYDGPSSHTWPLLVMAKDSSVFYSNKTSGWVASGVEMEFGKWHTVKLTVDIANKTCELYLDGQEIALDSTKFQFRDELTQLYGITFGFNSGAIGTAYLDDVVVTVGDVCEKLEFKETSLTIPELGSKYLVPVFTPNTSYENITYISSDDTVATVDADGMVTGIKAGTATITAIPADPKLDTIEIEVTVTGLAQGIINVPITELSLPVGGHDDLNANFAYDGENDAIIVDKTLVFESSAPEVATVDEYGEVLAVGAGTTTITISAKANPEVKKIVTVTVSEPEVMRTIYVSPDGTGNGSSAAAPTTLEGALAILESIPTAQRTGNIEIILADGYYYRTETLALTDAHSGSNLYSVIFKAAEGANVTIGGGMHIEGSKFTDENNDGIYEYDLSGLNLGDDFNTRQLFVDNVRAIRARGQVVPAKQTVLKNGEWLLAEDGKTKLGFICDNTELLGLDRPEDLELVYYNNWINSRCQVTSIEEKDGRVYIYMDKEPFYILSSQQDFKNMKPDRIAYYENALELLDEAGEWYYNAGTKMLYYMPRAWETMENVTVTLPVFDNWGQDDEGNVGLVTVIGTDFHQQAHNIRFEGITFADITWLRPDTKALPTNQNNYVTALEGKYNYGLPSAAITVKKANSIAFLDCTFTRLGSNGINMYDGVQNSLVQGCHFYDLSAGAVGIGQPAHQEKQYVDNFNPSDPKKMMKNVDVLNNYIHDTSVDYQSSAAISVGFAVNLDLSNNEIFNIPYSGFHIGYGWNRVFDSYTKGINVSENFVHDYMLDGLYDGGGIYVNGNTSGRNTASRNYFLNQGEKHVALYADTGTDWWSWEENVVDVSKITKGPTTGDVIYWSNGLSSEVKHDNQAIGNYYAGIQKDFVSVPETNTVYADNTRVVDLDGDGKPDWNEEALAIIAASGLEEAYAGLRNDQIERIVIAGSDEDVELAIDETFTIQLRGTDGKDREVDITKATIVYESLNTDVATVDANGVITGVGKGTATIRVHVVSNNIWDVVELSVVIGDDVTELKLQNVEATISLFETTGDQQLVAYGVTERGREAAFDTVTWTIGDETVATVDANGVLKVVNAGETTLTVTGQKRNTTVSATYTIVVYPAIEWETDYMEELFEAENADKWYHVDQSGYFTITDGEKIDAKVIKGKTYTGKKFEGELLTFRLSVADLGNWPSIVLRSQDETKTIGLGGTGYLICLPQTGIELHRFNGTTRTQFYGPVANPAPILGPSILPNALNDWQLHEIQVGAQNEAGGVRLVLYIDGVEIFNILDDQAGAIIDAGYFGLVGANGDLFTLEKMSPSQDETVEVKHNVTLESDIDFSFFVPKSAVAASGLTATVVQDRATGFEDKTVTLEQANWESYTSGGVEYWRIRYADVAAKEMTDKLTLTVKDASGVIATDTYSIAQYAKERIENSTNENMKNLMNIMLHYGAAAQVYFDYKTDDLANAGLAAASTASFRAAANAVSTVKHNLTLESNIDFSFFVPKSDVAASGLTATILHDRIAGYDDKSVSLAQAEWETLTSGGVEYWRIRYTDVAAKEIADSLTLTVTDGTNTVVTDSYSVLQYAQERVQNSSNENMKTLMQMLQSYGAAARLYFGYTAN